MPRNPSRARYGIFVAILILPAACVTASGFTVVVPNSNAALAGNTTNAFPGILVSLESQELIDNGQFPSPLTITALSFRAAPGMGGIMARMAGLTVTLSTSPNYPNNNGSGKPLMSSTFANNFGPDKTVVFSERNVTLNDSGCPAPGPCPFDITIPFTTPFSYTPSQGPLLIDLVTIGISESSGAFDAESFAAPGGSVAQVIGEFLGIAGNLSFSGNIMQFTYTSNYPQLTGVVNAASGIPPGFLNSGIAQGAVISIYGSNLGAAPTAPPTTNAATLPLPTTLAGTSVSVTVNGTTTNAPILFTTPTEIGAIMPSNTPLGNGQVNVTYNGLTNSTNVSVVARAFGISNTTIVDANNGIGMVQNAIATFGSSNQLVTRTNSAAPGDLVTIWGTGLGATTPEGDIQGSPAGNVGNPPILLLGDYGPIQLTYWGRSPGSPGLDQIEFVVPSFFPPEAGCNVPLVVLGSNSLLSPGSNIPTMPFGATHGAPCSDMNQAISNAILASGKATVKILMFGAQQNLLVNPQPNGSATTTVQTAAFANFSSMTQAQLTAAVPAINAAPSLGGDCYSGFSNNTGGGGIGSNVTPLNAGTQITLTPPSGSPIILTEQSEGQYGSGAGSSLLTSGTWNFSNGVGGPDVGPLVFNFPEPAQVTWTNEVATYSTAIRLPGSYELKWTGGDQNGYVDIQGFSTVGSWTFGFECAIYSNAGVFGIPSWVLGPIPPNSPGAIQLSTYSLPNSLPPVDGLDAALNFSQFRTRVPVTFVYPLGP